MYRQANVNVDEALPAGGDTINDLFAQHYQASFRVAYRVLRCKEDAEDAVMHLRERRRAGPWLRLDNILPVLGSHAATPEAFCYLAELQAAHAGAASKLPRVLYDVYSQSVLSGIALSKVADQLGLTAAALKSRLFRARKRVGNALQPVIQRRTAL